MKEKNHKSEYFETFTHLCENSVNRNCLEKSNQELDTSFSTPVVLFPSRPLTLLSSTP